MKGITIKALLLLSSICLLACSKQTVFSEFKELEGIQWNQDSVLRYEFNIEDTTSLYSVLFYIRHTEVYPYQNMWLFVADEATADTIEFYLADDRGRWLGNGKNGLIEMPVLYEQHYRFPHKGQYSLSLRQGMREENLRGISDIGLVIEKEEQK